MEIENEDLIRILYAVILGIIPFALSMLLIIVSYGSVPEFLDTIRNAVSGIPNAGGILAIVNTIAPYLSIYKIHFWIIVIVVLLIYMSIYQDIMLRLKRKPKRLEAILLPISYSIGVYPTAVIFIMVIYHLLFSAILSGALSLPMGTPYDLIGWMIMIGILILLTSVGIIGGFIFTKITNMNFKDAIMASYTLFFGPIIDILVGFFLMVVIGLSMYSMAQIAEYLLVVIYAFFLAPGGFSIQALIQGFAFVTNNLGYLIILASVFFVLFSIWSYKYGEKTVYNVVKKNISSKVMSVGFIIIIGAFMIFLQGSLSGYGLISLSVGVILFFYILSRVIENATIESRVSKETILLVFVGSFIIPPVIHFLNITVLKPLLVYVAAGLLGLLLAVFGFLREVFPFIDLLYRTSTLSMYLSIVSTLPLFILAAMFVSVISSFVYVGLTWILRILTTFEFLLKPERVRPVEAPEGGFPEEE